MAPRCLSGFDEICTCGGAERDDEGEAESTAAFSVTEPLGFRHTHTHTNRGGPCDGDSQQINGAAVLTGDAVQVFPDAH